jgi:TetR/AcrR family fatty acid metabolism transcriptional regulator
MGSKAEAKKQIILDAAMKVFAEKGYHYATVEDIAGEAGIAKGSVHAYFENKLDILLTLLLAFWKGINEANAGKLARRQEPVASLKTVFATFQDMLLNDANSLYWGRILQEGLPELHTLKSEELRKKQRAIAREARELTQTIDTIIRAGQERGCITSTIKYDALRQLLGGASQLLIYGLFMKSNGNADISYDQTDVHSSLDLLIDVLAAPQNNKEGS